MRGLQNVDLFFFFYMEPILVPGLLSYLSAPRTVKGKRTGPLEKIRVLLANRPRMMREVLTEMIRRQEDMELVGEVLEPLDVLVAVREMRADAVVLALEDYEEPGLCSHLLTEYPNLTILGLAPDGKTAFVRSPRREIGQPSEEAILQALRGNHRDVR